MGNGDINLTIPMVLSWELGQAIMVANRVVVSGKKLKQEVQAVDDVVKKSEPFFGEQAGLGARTLSGKNRTDAETTAGVYEAMWKQIDDGVTELSNKREEMRSVMAEVEDSHFDLFYEDDGSVRSRKSDWETARSAPFGLTAIYMKKGAENKLEMRLQKALWEVARMDQWVAERLSGCLEKVADSVKTDLAGTPTDQGLLDILRNRQVKDSDKDGVMWPNATQLDLIRQNVDKTFQPRMLTAEEAAVLSELSLGEQVKFATILMAADEIGKDNKYTQEYSLSKDDGKGDATRHIYWNARLTQEFGADWTERYTTAHEKTAGNMPAREAMDLHNNQLGRDIAMKNPNADDATIRAAVENEIDTGKAVVITGGPDNKTPQLAWSRDTPTSGTIVGPGVGIPLPGVN